MTAFEDSSFLSVVIFSCNLCQPAQSARHLRKLSLPTFVYAECLVTGAQYREGCWGVWGEFTSSRSMWWSCCKWFLSTTSV